MKFRDFYMLALNEDFEFDVIAGDMELGATVVPTPLTEDGWKFFNDLFESDVNVIVPKYGEYKTTVVEFSDKNIVQKADLFVTAQAGYIAASKYDRWFA